LQSLGVKGSVMRDNRTLCVAVLACIGLTLVPSKTDAETMLIPWLGANSGGPYATGAVELGAAVEITAAGIIGADFDFSYSPNFFGNGLSSSVLTTMGNVVVAIPFDRARTAGIRPYVTAGIGLIRASLDTAPYGYSLTSSGFGANTGGGIMGFFGSHLGVRVDLRYLHSFDDDANLSSGPVDLSRLHYWRTSFGVVIR
jgi:hypothetical protein